MTPAGIAASEFTRRIAAASRKVAQRQLTAQQASTLVLPWLALACRAGAELPELAGDLAALPAWYTDSQRRAVLADELCPRPVMIETLRAAAAAAVLRHERAGQPGTGDLFDRARRLLQLSRAFHAGPVRLPRTSSRGPTK